MNGWKEDKIPRAQVARGGRREGDHIMHMHNFGADDDGIVGSGRWQKRRDKTSECATKNLLNPPKN